MIRRVTSTSPTDVESIAKVMAEAFNLTDDALYAALYGGGAIQDENGFNELRFRGRVYEGIRDLETYVVEEGGRVAAAMIVEPPGPSIAHQPNPYTAEIEARTVPEVAEAQTKFHDVVHAFEESAYGSDTYYVSFLATAPWARRRGHAGRLLHHIINKAKDEGRVTTVTTTTESNISYYAKFGFRVIDTTTVELRGNLITLWAFNDEAQASD